jgi:diguanylate cyclase
MLEAVRFRGQTGIELARAILAALEARTIPPTPRNYELWTAYHLGVLADLSREMAGMIERGEAFTDETNDDLYERYIGSTRLSSEVMTATDTVARELAEALTNLRSAAKNAGDYSSELKSVTGEMEAGVDATSFKRIVTQLTAATKDMLAHNTALEHRMQESAGHITSLQETLQAVRLEALTDALTGLANRKHFDDALKRQCTDAATSGRPLSLIMCDIDHFKRINDEFGHPVGDSVIRFVGSVLKRSAAGDALAARYGGEEFAILLPNTELRKAVELAEHIRQVVRAQRPTRKSTGESLGTVTVSFGVAQLHADEAPGGLVQRADGRLYESKRAGRDRVTSEGISCAA